MYRIFEINNSHRVHMDVSLGFKEEALFGQLLLEYNRKQRPKCTNGQALFEIMVDEMSEWQKSPLRLNNPNIVEMDVEVEEKFGIIKVEEKIIPIVYILPVEENGRQDSTTSLSKTIITTEEDFNLNGFVFESDVKVEATTLQFQDDRDPPNADLPTTPSRSRSNGTTAKIVCPKEVVVKLTRLSNEMIRRIECPKEAVVNVTKLSIEMIKKYSGRSSLQKSPPKTKPFKCSDCSKQFRHKHNLHIHLRQHTGKHSKNYSCRICSKSYSNKSSLVDHLDVRHIGVTKYACNDCPKRFRTSQGLRWHRGKHMEDMPFQCDKCPLKFNVKAYLQLHQRIHRADSIIEKPFECYLCGRKYELRHFLEAHMRIHVNRYDCRICLKVFHQKGDLDKHMTSHSGKTQFECSTCCRGFNYRTNLLRHLRMHSGAKPFECEHCFKKFKEKDYLTAHMRTHTAEKTVDRSSYTWKYLNEQKYRQAKTYGRKKNENSGEIPSKRKVSNENKSNRVGKVFKCKICLKTFKQESKLNEHFGKHSGKYLFECSECSRGFDYRPNLYRHMRTHTVQERKYQCQLCPNKYAAIVGLQIHLRCHTGEKVECDVCFHKFSDKNYLRIHRRVHTGEMPFECTKCMKKFRSKQPLKLHKCIKDNASSPLSPLTNKGIVKDKSVKKRK